MSFPEAHLTVRAGEADVEEEEHDVDVLIVGVVEDMSPFDAPGLAAGALVAAVSTLIVSCSSDGLGRCTTDC